MTQNVAVSHVSSPCFKILSPNSIKLSSIRRIPSWLYSLSFEDYARTRKIFFTIGMCFVCIVYAAERDIKFVFWEAFDILLVEGTHRFHSFI